MKKLCVQCRETFFCEADNLKPCWCSELPLLIQVSPDSKCLCPNCLSAKMKVLFEAYPKKAKLYLENQPKKRKEKVIDFNKGLDYYLNEESDWVFTAFYHLKKGYCCQNACKHCPYGFKKTKP